MSQRNKEKKMIKNINKKIKLIKDYFDKNINR